VTSHRWTFTLLPHLITITLVRGDQTDITLSSGSGSQTWN